MNSLSLCFAVLLVYIWWRGVVRLDVLIAFVNIPNIGLIGVEIELFVSHIEVSYIKRELQIYICFFKDAMIISVVYSHNGMGLNFFY